MIRRLWLHCGTFKSGSSRIQNEAWARRHQLREQGWLYPRSGLVTDEPEVGYRHSRLVYRFGAESEWQGMVDALVEEITRADTPGVLMSSEAWSRPSAGTSLVALLGELADRADVRDVRAVLYVRNRYAYARSLYRELTRRRNNRLPLAEFVEANAAPLDPLRPVRRLQEIVGPGRLLVVPYEEAGDTAAHFFGLLGLRVPAAGPVANLSLGAVEVEAHRQLKLLAPELRDHFPGLPAILPGHSRSDVPGGEDPDAYVERLDPDQLASGEQWCREFAAATGWSAAQVDRLTERPADPARDVAELAPVLRAGAQEWLDRACTSRWEVTTHPHPDVAELALDPIPPGGPVRLAGCLLMRPGAGPGRLLAVDDTGEREVGAGQRSPAFGRRHPRRPEAARARFGLPRTALPVGGSLQLQLTGRRGERAVLADVRRRWEAPAALDSDGPAQA